MTRLVILQSSYIPWKGYFDLIHDADLFIFYDDVQFTPRDWRSRNQIKTPHGTKWLSVPVGSKRSRLICDVDIPSDRWQQDHYLALLNLYGKSPYFLDYGWLLEAIYKERSWKSLSELNQTATRLIAKHLGIDTLFRDSREFCSQGAKLDKLIDLIKKTGADTYISGPSAKAYIDEERFKQEGIKLIWKDYSGYPEYPQLFPPFEHAVTVLDLLFNVGPEASHYIWGWREE